MGPKNSKAQTSEVEQHLTSYNHQQENTSVHGTNSEIIHVEQEITPKDPKESRQQVVRVNFVWKHGAVDSVFVSGSFNSWTHKLPLTHQPIPDVDAVGPSKEDLQNGAYTSEQLGLLKADYEKWNGERYSIWKKRWTVTIPLTQGQYYFKYIVDGQWRHDPLYHNGVDPNGQVINILSVDPNLTVLKDRDAESGKESEQPNNKDFKEIEAEEAEISKPKESKGSDDKILDSEKETEKQTESAKEKENTKNTYPENENVRDEEPGRMTRAHRQHRVEFSPAHAKEEEKVESESESEEADTLEQGEPQEKREMHETPETPETHETHETHEHHTHRHIDDDRDRERDRDRDRDKGVDRERERAMSKERENQRWSDRQPDAILYDFASPLPLPSLFHRIILSRERKEGEEAILLPIPDHVTINHLYVGQMKRKRERDREKQQCEKNTSSTSVSISSSSPPLPSPSQSPIFSSTSLSSSISSSTSSPTSPTSSNSSTSISFPTSSASSSIVTNNLSLLAMTLRFNKKYTTVIYLHENSLSSEEEEEEVGRQTQMLLDELLRKKAEFMTWRVNAEWRKRRERTRT
ncbi:uncharacterized protein MONOS_13536 [Monocercomonoides exilis]|uniref:uncharacterized protein n=1 Tax=Monocercomonoides exilis TaxID=2049356 RepID=UPI003559800F|nr:hypothetical protein MONOS_13536 [Monocercomonoides exilis]|eukprot:MONOS_13536.1-p1 / transcript=MONOS_13536.1 / gene=MONOS_13536 / organism=Monocercomonoides_exilis_PA203 / gene_product=unspecified product / transcript_product=unspecified product / location=Mono_scaffold00841:21630-23417(-) / protein_length=578 / sequence_SO=supercontig / SO=protein_coding / is_pseudo=false